MAFQRVGRAGIEPEMQAWLRVAAAQVREQLYGPEGCPEWGAGWPRRGFARLGCRATRGYQSGPFLSKNLLFLRHPDAQSSVWATLPT